MKVCKPPPPPKNVCKTIYETHCETKYHEHIVEDDVVDCQIVEDTKCEDITNGYQTENKCTKWPRRECTSKKQKVKKITPKTECKRDISIMHKLWIFCKKLREINVINVFINELTQI